MSSGETRTLHVSAGRKLLLPATPGDEMAEVTPLPKLKQQRERMGLTPAQLAEALEVSEKDIATWERDPTKATPAQLADLSVLLSVPWVRGGRDATDEALLYGTLRLDVPDHRLEYPLDQRNRSLVLRQLSELDVQSEEAATWLYFSTMNNLIVFANPSWLQEIELESDDAEESPDFEHPAVYAALEDWEIHDEISLPIGPVVRRACEAAVEVSGEDAFNRTTHIRTISSSGQTGTHFILEEDDVLGIWTLELQSWSALPANRFMQIGSEGYHRERWVNLSNMAVIEVPAARYLRLVSSGEEASAE